MARQTVPGMALVLGLTLAAALSCFSFSSSSLVQNRIRQQQFLRWSTPRLYHIFRNRSNCRIESGAGRVRGLRCGLQVTVRIRGKKSREEDYTNQAYDEYVKRLRPVLALETQWHKTDEELEAAVRKDSGVVVCLDEGGSQMDSLAFADFLFAKLEHGGSRLTFAIGGAEGLPPGLKLSPPQGGAKLSLSKMTFTHLWARALLAEQIYRASEIRRGSKYHKE